MFLELKVVLVEVQWEMIGQVEESLEEEES
jgi:hypothetical protein